MGVGTRTKAWRFTDINKDYAVSAISDILCGMLNRTLVLFHIPIKTSGTYAH